MSTRIDHAALKVNQAAIIGLLVVAFLGNWSWLVAFVAAVMLVGTIWPWAGLFKLVYSRLLRPAGLVKPDVRDDAPEPHLFAQGVGGLVLAGAVVALLSGLPILGWALVAVVIALASVNLFLDFCLGCFLYYQLARRGIRPKLGRWAPVSAAPAQASPEQHHG